MRGACVGVRANLARGANGSVWRCRNRAFVINELPTRLIETPRTYGASVHEEARVLRWHVVENGVALGWWRGLHCRAACLARVHSRVTPTWHDEQQQGAAFSSPLRWLHTTNVHTRVPTHKTSTHHRCLAAAACYLSRRAGRRRGRGRRGRLDGAIRERLCRGRRHDGGGHGECCLCCDHALCCRFANELNPATARAPPRREYACVHGMPHKCAAEGVPTATRTPHGSAALASRRTTKTPAPTLAPRMLYMFHEPRGARRCTQRDC